MSNSDLVLNKIIIAENNYDPKLMAEMAEQMFKQLDELHTFAHALKRVAEDTKFTPLYYVVNKLLKLINGFEEDVLHE
jgi:hypothetical protein